MTDQPHKHHQEFRELLWMCFGQRPSWIMEQEAGHIMMEYGWEELKKQMTEAGRKGGKWFWVINYFDRKGGKKPNMATLVCPKCRKEKEHPKNSFYLTQQKCSECNVNMEVRE